MWHLFVSRFQRHYLHGLKLGMVLSLITGCQAQSNFPIKELTIGVITYDQEEEALAKYQNFQDYLSKQTHTVVTVEPVLNEVAALEKIKSKDWSMVFAPPGVAAIAIGQEQYIPIFVLDGLTNVRSVMVVPQNSNINSLQDLTLKRIVLGQRGSATGYYLPLYDLYGLDLAEIQLAPTPKNILERLAKNQADAGALSEEQFQTYRYAFSPVSFRILHQSRSIPSSVILLSPLVERKQQQILQTVMAEAPRAILEEVGYFPKRTLPNYEPLIQLIKKVKPLENKIKDKPLTLK